MDRAAKIYVAGHRGMVGSALVRALQAAGLAEQVARVVVPGFGTRYHGADGEVLFRAGAPVKVASSAPISTPLRNARLCSAANCPSTVRARV